MLNKNSISYRNVGYCFIPNLVLPSEEALRKNGYCVSRAYSGTEALLVIKDSVPDLVLLDLMLPGITGEEQLPQIKNIPVIVASAKTDIIGKVELLSGGAVDYITKPFDIRELLARIEVQLRNPSIKKTSIVYKDITMNISIHSVSGGETDIKLTKTEYAILKQLMINPTQVVTKSHLLDLISFDTPDCTENSLKVT